MLIAAVVGALLSLSPVLAQRGVPPAPARRAGGLAKAVGYRGAGGAGRRNRRAPRPHHARHRLVRCQRVSVRDGVVFLDGTTGPRRYRRWAGDLAQNTQGTVAVVNRIEVEARRRHDLRPRRGRADAALPPRRAGLAARRAHRRHSSCDIVALARWSAARRGGFFAGAHRLAAAVQRGGARLLHPGLSARPLFRAAGRRADAACPHRARRHRPDRHHHRLRLPRHRRELSRQPAAQHAQPVPAAAI